MTARQWHAPVSDPRKLDADCDNCPIARWAKMHQERLAPIWPDGPNAATLAIVGEGPGQKEVKAGVPFIGPSGQFLAAQLSLHGLERRDVWLDNATLCFPPGGSLDDFEQSMAKRWKNDQRKQRAMLQAKAKEHRKLTGERLEVPAELPYKSAVECCRPRLWRTLRLPLCAKCRRPVGLEGALPVSRCVCETPKPMKLARGVGATPKALLLTGSAALEALTGVGGVQSKQGYVFNHEGHVK